MSINILEGSVQKANDQVRVNVQLINAMTDAHLWAETYDRKLTDIFAVESDIAKTIAETLQAKTHRARRKTRSPKCRQRIRKLTNFISKADFFGTSGPARTCTKRSSISIKRSQRIPTTRWLMSALADSYLLLSSYSDISPRESLPPARAALKRRSRSTIRWLKRMLPSGYLTLSNSISSSAIRRLISARLT